MAEPVEGDHEEPDDLTSEDLRNLIEAQKEEAQLELEKQKTRRLELEAEERQAERALEAQLKDREGQRKFQESKSKREQRYGIVYFLMLLVFFGYLVWLGYTDIVYEIIRVLLYGGAGWAAGRSVGAAQSGSQQPSPNGE